MADWRNRIIERKRMRVGELAINRYNPKHHPRVQQERLEAVLDKFGIVGDLVAYYSERNEGKLTLFDGHARQGLDPNAEWEVGITDLSDAEVDELVLYFDPLAALARQEADRTAALMADLDVQERALREMLEEQAQSLGFAYGKNGKEEQAPKIAEAQIDKAEQLQEIWQVKLNDVWVIPSRTGRGEHRIICGDSTDRNRVTRLAMEIGAVITDPPYAFGLSSIYSLGAKSGGWHDMMNNASWFSDRQKQWRDYLKKGPIWIFSNWRTLPILMKASYDSGIGIESVMVWYKDWIGPGGQLGLRPTYELVALSVVGGYGIPDRGVEDFIKSAWSSHKPHGHQSEKPSDLICHLIKISECDNIFDPFLGSGTTIVACEQTGRIGYGMDLEPKYIAVTLQRLQDLGLDPRLVE